MPPQAVYKDNLPISTEFILLSSETVFSYLGGTNSEYFNTRPNDFLKVNMMNWARKLDFKYYVLGGGRANEDSLYDYKKFFFPKDEDVIFYTGRKVLNQKIYQELVVKAKNLNGRKEIKEDKLKNKNSTVKVDTFFPTYRI